MQALLAGRWSDARRGFLVALKEHESAEALEGVAKAAWWLGSRDAVFVARERAYRLYRQRGDSVSAARLAVHLAADHCCLRDARAVADGWLQRAQRLLDGLDATAEHAWLALWQGQVATLLRHDPAASCRHSASAADLAQALGLRHLVVLARAQEGLALISQGGVVRGGYGPDDASALVGSVPTDFDLVLSATSTLIYTWEQTRDFSAVEQWFALFHDVPEPWSSSGPFWSCRTLRTGALVWRGAWNEAEAELEASAKALSAIGSDMAAQALARLARLRLRQGRYEESVALLDQAESQPLRLWTETQVLLGWAELLLDEGDPEAARASIERVLASLHGTHPTERLAPMELLVRAEVAFGKLERSQEALVKLQRASCSVATDGVRGATRFAEGVVAHVTGALDAARTRLEEAVVLFQRAGACFAAAQARTELAVTLLALGHRDHAEREAATALQILCSLGAAHEAERVQSRVPQGRSAGAPPGVPAGGLTTRELEVLRLVAQGQSNQAIAATLIVSVRTVERHLSNIYDKIGASGKVARAVAIAYGLRHGLVAPER